MWQLVINGPGYFDTAYDLPDGITQVGRADENDVVLSGDLVSRKHCRFHVKPTGLVFEDLGSRNGTRLNGEPVRGHVPVQVGDVVAVGENTLSVRQVRDGEQLDTESVDVGAGGQVKRFGRGVDVRESVLFARDVRDAGVHKALDAFAPFDLAPPPVPDPARASVTDESPAEAQLAMRSLLLLYRVAEFLSRTGELQAFLEEACDLTMRRVGATTGVVLLRHESGVMVPAAVRHSKKLARGEVPVSDAIIDAALAQGQALAVADVRDDSRFAQRESVVEYGVEQVLCVPIGTRAPFAGVLYLNRARADEEPLDTLLDVCTAVTQLLHAGIQRFHDAPDFSREAALRRAFERIYPGEVAARRLVEVHQPHGRITSVAEVNATVLVAQVVGLSTVAGKLPVDRLGELLDEWQRLAARHLLSFEGAVDSVGGDSVRAVFGAPTPRHDDAIRAVRAAMSLRDEWERLASRRPPRERFRLRVGLHTGKVLAGVMGTEGRVDPVLLGETADLAGAVCASAEPGQVLLSGRALAHVGARFDVNPLGERTLAGTKVKASLFEALDEDLDSGTMSGIR